MADELLSHIIRLESEIQDQLQHEQDRAEAWLEQVREEEGKRLARVCADQEIAKNKALADARRQADRDAFEIEERERLRCQCLETLGDDELEKVLKRHLIKVLPRRNDDHQNVQS